MQRTPFNITHALTLAAIFKELHLVVTDADDGIAADHADWVDAGFIIGEGKGEEKTDEKTN